MIGVVLGIVLGLVGGAVSGIITGISLPLLILAIFNMGIVSSNPYAVLVFVVCYYTINMILTTLSSHYTHVSTSEVNLFNFRKEKEGSDERTDIQRELFERGRDLRANFNERIKGLRIGVLYFGIPLILLSKILPIGFGSFITGGLSFIAVPVLVGTIVLSCIRAPKLIPFVVIGGVFAWFMFNSPALSHAPSNAPILLLFSAGISIPEFAKRFKSFRPRDNREKLYSVPWLDQKYFPDIARKYALKPFDYIICVAGGTLAGATPSFVGELFPKLTNPRALVKIQSIAEVLSLAMIFAGSMNARTMLSAELVSIMKEPTLLIGLALLLLIEVMIQFAIWYAPKFVRVLNYTQFIPEHTKILCFVIIPNITLMFFVLPFWVALWGTAGSAMIGFLHYHLKLEKTQFVTVLALPTIAILCGLNPGLTALIFGV